MCRKNKDAMNSPTSYSLSETTWLLLSDSLWDHPAVLFAYSLTQAVSDDALSFFFPSCPIKFLYPGEFVCQSFSVYNMNFLKN